MTRQRRLGRGLEALLNATRDPAAGAAEEIERIPFPRAAGMEADSAASGEGELIELDVHEIDENPFQPRRDFSEAEIGSLAESLKTHDLLQPILVRRVGARHQLISGERRLRAAIQAGWTRIPARVRQADDRLVAELAIVENLQRKDLNAIEKAWSFRRYLDQHHATQDELAQRLKIDRSTIANLMRLLELPAAVQDAVRSGAISAGHARALLPLGDEPLQIDFCQRIQREGWSVRHAEQQVAELVQRLDNPPPGRPHPRSRRPRSEHVEQLEQELKRSLGTRVEIRQAARGRGSIRIQFSSPEEFERLLRLLTAEASAGRAA